MSGIADVARMAGVSKSTASRALSGSGYVAEETRARVTAAASSLGYVASANAASLVTGRTRSIAVIVPHVNRWYFGALLEGIERTLIPHGYDLTLYVTDPDSQDQERVYRYFLARKRFDGVIAATLEPEDEDVERIIAIGKPTVGIGNALEGIVTLGIDNLTIARMITQHVLALGHVDIAFVGSTPAGHPSARDVDERVAGYSQAMRSALLADRVRLQPATLTLTDGYAAATTLLADVETRPTAIVAACDEIAVGVIIAARRLGIAVPAQLSVIGIDGHEYADMFSLTTMEQEPAAQGGEAARMLLSMIDGTGHPPARTTAPARLVMRASTARPPGL